MKVREVIRDAKKANARAAHLVRTAQAHQGKPIFELDALVAAEPKKKVGEHWNESAPIKDTACPLGQPNCRNCGDPAYKDACAAAGHCPQCGTAHGIAPDSVVKAAGVELVPVSEQEWQEHLARQAEAAQVLNAALRRREQEFLDRMEVILQMRREKLNRELGG